MKRCKEHFQGDRCKLELGHSEAEHESAFHVWKKGEKIDELPPTKRIRKGATPDVLSFHEKRILACKGYNLTHKKKEGDPSTISIVERMTRKTFRKMVKAAS